jgi:uncharacterized protein (DUF1330 family)
MPQRRFVIVEFDSPEAAKAFYDADDYHRPFSSMTRFLRQGPAT